MNFSKEANEVRLIYKYQLSPDFNINDYYAKKMPHKNHKETPEIIYSVPDYKIFSAFCNLESKTSLFYRSSISKLGNNGGLDCGEAPVLLLLSFACFYASLRRLKLSLIYFTDFSGLCLLTVAFNFTHTLGCQYVLIS